MPYMDPIWTYFEKLSISKTKNSIGLRRLGAVQHQFQGDSLGLEVNLRDKTGRIFTPGSNISRFFGSSWVKASISIPELMFFCCWGRFLVLILWFLVILKVTF